jgi:hypothetical protein
MNQNPTEQPVKAVKRLPWRILFAVVVVAILLSAAVIVLLENDNPDEPELWISYVNLNFFNRTMFPVTEGYILWAIAVSMENEGDQWVAVDPCEFIVETGDGELHYFAWRYGNLTGISIDGEEYVSGMPTNLPGPGRGTIQAPYELPGYAYPTRILWKSTLGEVLSEDFGERGQQRLNEFLDS